MSEVPAVKPEFVEMARTIYGIAHRRVSRRFKIAAIAEYLESVCQAVRGDEARIPSTERGS